MDFGALVGWTREPGMSFTDSFIYRESIYLSLRAKACWLSEFGGMGGGGGDAMTISL